ncbi:MAG: hypothetical protein IPJ87_00105 [Flavobacteriales bacterium]|nr:hypothetical protein [Flavobacteriales bacterium]
MADFDIIPSPACVGATVAPDRVNPKDRTHISFLVPRTVVRDQAAQLWMVSPMTGVSLSQFPGPPNATVVFFTTRDHDVTLNVINPACGTDDPVQQIRIEAPARAHLRHHGEVGLYYR